MVGVAGYLLLESAFLFGVVAVKQFSLLLVVVVVFVHSQIALSQTPVLSPDAVKALRLPDVHIDSAEHVSADEPPRNIDVAHVKVLGTIGGSIRFELLLPDEWNGRFAMGGGGGLVGSIQNAAKQSVNKGFATVGTDTGHQAEGTDGSWAHDDLEALVNFGHVAIHRTSEVSKAIMRAYYKKGPDKSYFVGCSRGGGQALMEAQRYPQDFDGIVSGAPAFDWPGVAALFIRISQAMYPDPEHLTSTSLTNDDLNTLYDEIMKQVDELDGLKDGIIDDPTAVKFDIDKVEGLSEADKAAARVVYEGVSNADGPIYPGFPIGAEKGAGGWYGWLVGPIGNRVNLAHAFGTNIFKYFVFNDPDWDYSRYDFEKFEKDTRLMGSLLSAKNPDLSRFAKRNGRLIIWHGWADAALPAQGTIDYYEKVVERDPKAKDYARLFMIPGCYHCGGGPGISQVNWLDVIVDWVEHGKVPERIVAKRPARNGNPKMTRPLVPFPQRVAAPT